MSGNSYPVHADELKAAVWEKDKKSAFDAKSELADKLKALQKKHESIDWKLFADGWVKSAKTAAELEAENSKRDKAYAGFVQPLKKDAQAVAGAAKKAESKADKLLLATLKSIVKAAETYIDEIDQGAQALREAYEKAQDALPEEDDEDSKPAALIDPKVLLKQLNMCRKDAERTVKFAFVDAAGKQEAMLVLHPRLSGRALFGKLQAASGVKTGAYGSAWVDGMNLMLQLDKPLTGLVKKVRQPVRTSGFKISKAIIWNEDGTVFEQDDSADGAPGTAHEGTEQAATQSASADAAQEHKIPPPPDAAKLAFAKRLLALKPEVDKAAVRGDAQATRMLALLESARQKAKDGDLATAGGDLDTLEALLPGASTGAAPTPSAGTTAGAVPKVAGATGPEVQFRQSRLAWDGARKTVQAELRKLEASILDQCKDEPDFAEIAGGTKNLYTLLNFLDERLMDKLDEALNATAAAERDRFHLEAREIVDEYVDFIDGEALMQDIDTNGFVGVSIKSTLTASLKDIGQRLRA